MLRYLRILAIADIHSPRYLHLFIASLSKVEPPVDLMILAGDAIDRGKVEAFKPVLEALNKIRRNTESPIIAVFGNEEYFDKEKEFYKLYPEVVWLNDSQHKLELHGVKLCIVGSRGILQKPTAWQSKHIPGIHDLYRRRLIILRDLLRECRNYGITILVTHYASSFATVYGEPPMIYSYLGYPFIESLQNDEKPYLAIHGHAHNSKRLRAFVNGVEVHNVALPARRDLTLIDLAIESKELRPRVLQEKRRRTLFDYSAQ